MIKEKILKQLEMKTDMLCAKEKGKDVAIFSLEIRQVRQWSNIFKSLKEKNCQIRILYAGKT